MPATQYVWGVRIYLRDSLTQDTDIGLYTAAPGALSELRWIERTLDAADNWGLTWKPGLLVRDAFSPIAEGADLRRCGGASLSEEFNVTVCNVDKLCHDITSGGIDLVGCRVDIVEFEYDTSTLAQVSRVVGSGVCEEPRWTETDFTIPIRESSYKRNAPLGELIDEGNSPDADTETMGECVPLTFGELRPNALTGSPDTYAKLIRTAKAQSDWKDTAVNYGLFSVIEVGSDPERLRIMMLGSKNIELKAYPVIPYSDTPPLKYAVRFATSVFWQKWDGAAWQVLLSGTHVCDLLVGMYLHVIDGKSDGRYRKIKSAYVNIDSDAFLLSQGVPTYDYPTYLWCEVYEYFEETLAGNGTATAEDQSWVEIIGIEREYEADRWPCRSFTDDSGAEVSSPLYLYSYSEQSKAKGTVSGGEQEVSLPVTEKPKLFIRLPQFAYTEIAGGDKNSVEINATLFKDDPDEMFAYNFIPVTKFNIYTQETLTELNAATDTGWQNYAREPFLKNAYLHNNDNEQIRYLIEPVIAGTPASVADRSLATYYSISTGIGRGSGSYGDVRSAYMFYFPPPAFSESIIFDKCYLGIYARWEFKKAVFTSGQDCKFVLRWRRWTGYSTEIVEWSSDIAKARPYQVYGSYDPTGEPSFANLPDCYTGASTGSKYFYYENPANNKNIWGLSRYELDDIDSYDKYKTIDSVIFGVRAYTANDDTFEQNLTIHELCMILEKSISIKECIYSPMKGRIYDDTWGSRRTAANLMTNPIDILEHVLRLQNWSETGEAMPAAGWGHAYASTAKIDTSTAYGGFDHASLDGLKAATCARQVLSIDETATREMVDSLCRDFFLCQFKRTYTTTPAEAGQERVAYLLNDTAASESITLADVVGDIGQIQEPKIEDIYCEPYVRFCWNPAREKFDRIIRVRNSSAASWVSTYTPGFSAYEGEAFWNLCHEMWTRYGVVTPAPKHMTDKYWIYSYAEAKQYLERWISWMQLRRVNLSVGYVKGRAWHVAMKVNLTLPHHTNGTSIECLIERISKSKNDNRVELDLIMLDNVTTESMYLQESYQTKTERGTSGYADQEESYQTKAERGGTGTNDWEEQT